MTSTTKQVIGLAAVLTVIAVALMSWKVSKLGFDLLPGKQTQAIELEATVRFDAVNEDGDGVRVALGLPDSTASGLTVLSGFERPARGYAVLGSSPEETPRVTWTSRQAIGEQELSFRLRAVELRQVTEVFPDPVGGAVVKKPSLTESQQTLINGLLEQVRTQSDDDELTQIRLLLRSSNPDAKGYAAMVAELEEESVGLQRLLARSAGFQTRTVYTLRADKSFKNQAAGPALQVYVREAGWQVFDPKTGEPSLPKGVIVWHQGGPLLVVEGGKNSSVTFSGQPVSVPLADVIAKKSGLDTVADLRWSLFSLPVATQSAFQRLLLVPLGVLVVVLMRNIIGIKTSGTFMPILMALAFVETTLFFGLLLFGLIIALGVMLRGYLTSMNLLLVPRIGAVVILVILLMLCIAIVANALGLGGGVAITFFPMIILAWTIERLSIAAEEAGSGEALQQIGGSLFVAICAYLLMDNRLAQHVTFNFPEVCLIIMSLILLIGIYSGFRLTELRRFEPLTRHDQASGSEKEPA